MAQSSLTAPASDATSFATSSSQVDSDFDVFLNHRGPDVKKNLANHLYRSLKKHGLRVFLDDQEMRREDGMIPQIQRAIQTASVHVAIFSQRYAESTWFLDELVMMLESMSTIIPVFLDVNPSELRWIRDKSGLYARALNMREKQTTFDSEPSRKKPRNDSNTMEKWRNALSQVSYISSFELKSCDGDEEHLVELVVEELFCLHAFGQSHPGILPRARLLTCIRPVSSFKRI